MREKREIIKVDKKEGYELRTEKITEGGRSFEIVSAYTPKDEYIGDEKIAKMLIEKYSIKPELSPATNCDGTPSVVCCIGFSEKNNKWYGWSHRAIHGFSIGDVAKEGDCVCSSGWTEEFLKEHPEMDLSIEPGRKVETMDDARQFAIAFAQSVS